MANGTNVGNAYLQIVPTSQGIVGSVRGLLNKDAGDVGNEAGGIMGKLMGSGAVKAVAALGLGTAIAGVVKSAIGEGSELEQNMGGTVAVFGDFADEVQQKASGAYSAMGLSASDYMATVNKMGSLFQGSGLEQAKAMELSTAAMERAADVASVMGIDTTMAMESIAGAAKGNFTMMDNLGVAMNATTLEAYALEKGVNFKWNTASNAEKAELAMAMFMDRTSQYAGNFAKEAEGTFSGSLAAMQAAWKNVLGNMSTGGDIKGPLEALGQSASAFVFNNLIPMILNSVSSLPGALVNIASTAISQLVVNLPNLAMQLFTAVGNLIMGLGDAVINAVPQLWGAFSTLFTTVWEGASSIDWQGLGTTIINKIKGGWDMLSSVLPSTLSNIGTNASNFFKSVDWVGLGTTVINYITTGITTVMNMVPEILTTIANTAMNFVQSIDWQGLGSNIVKFIANGIRFLATNVPTVLSNIGQNAKSLFQNIDWAGLGSSVINYITTGLRALITSVPNVLKGIATTAWQEFKSVDWWGLGSSIISGIISGIGSAASSLFNKLRGLASDALGAAKSALGINSPSKVFANVVGRAIPEGIGKGVDDFSYYAIDAIESLNDELTTNIDAQSIIGAANTSLSNAINSGASDNTYIIELTAEIDGTELKSQVSDYTIKKIGNQQRNQLRMQGV